MEVVPEADASQNVDKSEDVSRRVTEKGSRVASNSALTDSNAAIAAAAASARAAVVASAVSSMTALVATAATSMHPPAFHAPCSSRFTPGSTFIRGMPGRGKRMSVASVAPSGVAGGMSSFFLGYAPWPKEGPKDVEEEGNSNKLTPTTTCYTLVLQTPLLHLLWLVVTLIGRLLAGAETMALTRMKRRKGGGRLQRGHALARRVEWFGRRKVVL